jgi:hypothetical protein
VFDYRYHALSLAAVLLALAVGVVIGVAIGDSNLVSSAKNGIVHDLKEEVNGSQHQSGQLRAQLTSEETFANDLYPIAVHGLLSGRNIGLVFLGSSSDRVNDFVRDAVTQAGGDLATVVAVREPLDLSGIAREAAGTRYAALGAEPAAGAASSGEGRELLSRARGRLLSAFDGQLGRLEGLVLVRADPTGMAAEQAKASTAFETGLLDGLATVGVATVGVELSSTEPSQIPWYESKDISSVDDLETTAGQAALLYALTGSHGAYGTKSSADSLLPNVVGTPTQP